jgi:hypothetical protein
MEAQTQQSIRSFFEQSLREYWQERYAAHQKGTSSRARFLEGHYLKAPTGLNASIHDAYGYYIQHVRDQDWGNAHLIHLWIGETEVYAVHVTTEGDDGWIEVFTAEGELAGAARRYMELLAWEDSSEGIRERVQNGSFPPALADRAERTLWGKS